MWSRWIGSWLREWWVVGACLGLAVGASAAILVAWTNHLTFYADDWELLVRRQGWGAGYFLHPFHEHIVIGPALTFRLLLALFGMGSAFPFYAVSLLAFLLSGVLLFVYVRRRVGDVLALVAAVLVLFLGAAFEDLMFAFQVGFFVSVAAGIGMLIALDREDEWGDCAACALLAVSLVFSSLGIAFAVGALVDLAFGRQPRSGRAYVALAPISLYAAWWFGWGYTAQHHMSLHNLLATPKFVFDSAAAGITSLFGLATGDGSESDQPHLIWGKIVLIPALVLLAVGIARRRRVPRGLAIALAIGLAFWVLAGVDRIPYRFPTSSRYQYPSAVFLLLIAAEMARGVRIPKLAVAAAVTFAGAAAIGGLSLMHREQSQRWLPASESLRSYLSAVEIAGRSDDPRFKITFPPSIVVPARTYLATAGEYGSPAFAETQLGTRPEAERATADLAMASMLEIALVPPSGLERTVVCEILQASGAGHTGVTLLQGGFTLANTQAIPVEVLLSRFADGLSVDLGPLEPRTKMALSIPVDNSTRPWNLGLSGEGSVRLCTTSPV